ncbi:MAG: YkgJ family cysteine cluster protein [Rubrivivax sp.]|nr:MAG: YkgJ family cysteine cluster protein [Rubrivivax sp.]
MSDERFLQHARPETAQASQELQKMPVREALVRFYARHDARIEAAVNAASEKLGCESGCGYCCSHFEVEARPFEVFEIQAHVLKHFKPEQLRATIGRAAKNVEERKAATETERLTLRQTCPFLVDNACSVYSVRPSVCRNYHATDREKCKKHFEDPTSTWPTSYIDDVFFRANGSSIGFKNAVKALGLDTKGYYLSGAFLEAVRNPDCAKRFKAGKKAFLKASSSSDT